MNKMEGEIENLKHMSSDMLREKSKQFDDYSKFFITMHLECERELKRRSDLLGNK